MGETEVQMYELSHHADAPSGASFYCSKGQTPGEVRFVFFVFHIIINYAYSYADDQLSAAVRNRMPFTSDQPFMKGKRGPFVLLRES